MSVNESDSPPSVFERVGEFRFMAGPGRWEWSDAVARMHGFEPGVVVPTTDVIRAHEHPDDRPAAATVVEHVLRHHGPVSSQHRIIDADGRERVVVVAANAVRDTAGEVIGAAGFYVDVTESIRNDVQRAVSEALATVDERRAKIHEAIGVVRMAYGVSADRAFDVLTWRSQQTNVKLRVIARQFVDRLVNQPPAVAIRAHVDAALLSAHRAVGMDG